MGRARVNGSTAVFVQGSRWTWVRGRAAALCAALLCVAAFGLAAPLTVAAAGDEPSPLDVARQSGVPVEVPAERAEYAQVFAEPDGRMRMDMTVSPVWARGADGQWHRPDATLERKPDGSVGPRFDIAGARFSGGGSGPMAVLSRAGATLRFGWPGGNLPAPVLDGTRATYAEVWPGVDLILEAATDGFRPVLVIKTAQAARLPQLSAITFPVATTGGSLRDTAGQGFEFVDPSGTVVFSGPAGVMWDSSGDAGLAVPKAASEASIPGRQASAGWDRVRRVPADATSAGLSITADPAWLSDPARVFPLFLDPVTGAGTPTYTMVSSGGWEAWKFTGDEAIGECASWNGYYCGDGFVKRMFFQFSKAQADALAGKEVIDATFQVYETWSFQCDDRWVNLYETDGAISSSTTWPGPAAVDLMGDRYVSAGRDTLCSPAQPDAWVKFNDNPDETNENLKPTVAAWVAGNYDLTFRLSAADEADTAALKRFQGSNASLQVYYRPIPVTPTPFGVQTGVTTTTYCGTSTSPTIVDTASATFRGTVQSQTNGDAGQTLRLQVGYSANNTDGSWSAENLTTSTTDVLDNTSVTIAKPVTAGYFYRVRAWTGSTYSGIATKYSTSATGYCYFLNDPTAPATPTITAGAPYTYCDTNDCVEHGAPGTPGTFTVTVPIPELYVTQAHWALRDVQHENPPAATGTATVTNRQAQIILTPVTDGVNYLDVYVTDTWGRASLAATFGFNVGI